MRKTEDGNFYEVETVRVNSGILGREETVVGFRRERTAQGKMTRGFISEDTAVDSQGNVWPVE